MLLTVHSDGSLDVTEELIVRLAADSNEIIRDLPLRGDGAREGSKKLDVRVLAVTDEDGQPLRVEETSRDGGWTRRLRIRIPGAGDADRRIAIRYRVANAIHFGKAGKNVGALEEVRWNVTGSVDMPIDSVHARLVLPAGTTAIRTAVYAGQDDTALTDATTRKNGNEVSFALSRGVTPHEAMTIRVAWPPGSMTTRPREGGGQLAAFVRRSPTLIPIIVFFVAFMKWLKRGRDPEEGSIEVQFEPVDGATPAELGALIDNTADLRDTTSTLVDLAVRGFIRIEETPQSKILGLDEHAEYIIYIVKKHAEWIGLRPHEIRILGALSSASPFDPFTVLVSQLRNTFPRALPRIRDGIFDSLVSRGYYRERPDEVRKRWVVVAAIIASIGYALAKLGEQVMWLPFPPNALMISGVVSAVIVLAFGLIMPARTVAGARARGAALGFKEFLGRVEGERYKKMITSPEMFERFLPYAMAFGVEKKWAGTFAHAFEVMYRNPPSWYTSSGGNFTALSLSEGVSGMSKAAAISISSGSRWWESNAGE